MRFSALWLVQFVNFCFVLVSISVNAEVLSSNDPSPNSPPSEDSLLEVSMLVEVAAEGLINANEPDALSLATFELAGHIDLTKRLYSDVLFSYDEEAESLEFDTFVLGFQHEDEPKWLLLVGQNYLPFGAFLTHQLQDTLSLEMSEIRQLYSGLSYADENWIGEFYTYENEEEKRGKLGGRIGFQAERFYIEVDYIESLYESQAVSVHGHININDVMLIAEHVVIEHKNNLAFVEDEKRNQSQTQHVEIAYQYGAITMSISYQESDALEDFELAEQKTSLTVRGDINQYTHLGIELGRTDGEEDLMMQLAVML